MNTRRVAPHRIVFCITELEPGGAERCLVELVKRLDRQRFEALVYCLGPRPLGNPTSLAVALEQAGVTVRSFGARRSIEFPGLLLKLRRQLAADAPRIVQSFLFHANVLAAAAARWSGVPHVVTGIRVAERGQRWHLTLARWTDRWVDRHVCVSAAVCDFTREQAGLPESKLLVIPNGVDAQRFDLAKPCPLSSLGVAPGRRAITFVGRLDEQKGLPWLFERMPAILAQLPSHDLLMVGSGPQRDLLVRRVQDLGLAERVHFVGFRDDVSEIMATSDMLVLASRWEGMPNVILEAMASGKPVVATDVEGVAELLGPGAEQQTAPLGDAESFVHKVLTILGDPRLAAQLGQQNRDRARQEFSLDAMAAAYERLYSSLLGGDA